MWLDVRSMYNLIELNLRFCATEIDLLISYNFFHSSQWIVLQSYRKRAAVIEMKLNEIDNDDWCICVNIQIELQIVNYELIYFIHYSFDGEWFTSISTTLSFFLPLQWIDKCQYQAECCQITHLDSYIRYLSLHNSGNHFPTMLRVYRIYIMYCLFWDSAKKMGKGKSFTKIVFFVCLALFSVLRFAFDHFTLFWIYFQLSV